jgi:uncharacterized protein YmfQ (DUF2313 family)
MDAGQYALQFLQLLPPGVAWSREVTSTIGQVFLGLAAEAARLDARMAALVEEADPRTTLELLPDWERVTGLPDPCAGDDQTLAGRRRRVVTQLTQVGGQSPDYYVAVAADLGYAITITEGETNPWSWRVHAPSTTIEEMTCNSFCDESIRSWGNDVLECALNRIKPAHTTVEFAYA